MPQPNDAAVLERAKALAHADGFAWELDFGAPGGPRAKLRGQHFLSRERQQEYLERARVDLRKLASTP